MSKLIKSVATMLAFVFASMVAQAGEWPATAEALMSKKKITITMSEVRDIVLEDNSYKLYRRGRTVEPCRKQPISEVVKISENVVEYRTQKEGSCDAKILSFNLAEKRFNLLVYEGDRSKAKEESKAKRVDFD